MKNKSPFDPNVAASCDSGIFGLPYTETEAKLVYLPVPWEATTSYGGGTAQAPAAILKASHQVDLYDLELKTFYEAGLCMLKESVQVKKWNNEAKARKTLGRVNALSCKVNRYVYTETKRLLDQDKIVGVVGGDHSVPFGALQAIAEKHPSFGVLHFDAHSDTRKAYEGFEYSHASIYYNVLKKIPEVTKLVQVGIRDFCEAEIKFCEFQSKRVQIFFDWDLKKQKFEGVSWKTLTEQIIQNLPQEVWVSFDIDGLDPRFCPNTGTPVPGGLDFDEALFVISALVKSGRKILGFDLSEVAPGKTSEWDANVGARLLYKLSGWTLLSQGLLLSQKRIPIIPRRHKNFFDHPRGEPAV